jgi:hypothetical protein
MLKSAYILKRAHFISQRKKGKAINHAFLDKTKN